MRNVATTGVSGEFSELVYALSYFRVWERVGQQSQRELVGHMLQRGGAWAVVADTMGLSVQEARQRYVLG